MAEKKKPAEETQSVDPAAKTMKLAEKLAHIQYELKAPKNKWNKFGEFYYRNTESVFEGIKPLLIKYLCTLRTEDEITVIGERYYVKSTAIIRDTETGEEISACGFAREEATKKGMDGAMITGATSSYARKYALGALLLLDDSEDNDSEQMAAAVNHAVEQEQRAAENPEEKTRLAAAREELIGICKNNKLDKVKVAKGLALKGSSTSEEVYAKIEQLNQWISTGQDLSAWAAE